MEKLVQPKMLYCKTCDVFLLPDYRLRCDVCGNTLTTCWWALQNRKSKVKGYCDVCENKFWCWTHKLGDEKRLPSKLQARIIQNADFERICTWEFGKEG